jgi:hypothetical protein
MPDGFHTNGLVANHRMNEQRPKPEKCICEYCEIPFTLPNNLHRHLKTFHAMEFANTIAKYYSIATKLATPTVVAALRVMKATVFGIAEFEVLLENESLVILNFILYFLMN